MLRRSLVFWVLLGALLLVRPSVGLGAPEQAKVQARALKAEAERLRASGQTQAALERYQAAYGVFPTPLLLWPMAQLHLELGHAEEGLAALRRFEEGVLPEQMPPGQGPAELQTVRARLLELQRPKAAATLSPLAPAALVTPVIAKQPEPRQPVYKKWWFWGTLGVVAAGTAVGITLGVLASQDPLAGVPDGGRRVLSF